MILAYRAFWCNKAVVFPLDTHFALCYSIHTILFWRECAGNNHQGLATDATTIL